MHKNVPLQWINIVTYGALGYRLFKTVKYKNNLDMYYAFSYRCLD